MEIKEINGLELDNEVNNNDKLVVDCYAPWCGPCKLLAPIMEELAVEFKNIKFLKINVDENEKIAVKYGIMSIPTILVFENGKLKEELVGLKSKEELSNLLK